MLSRALGCAAIVLAGFAFADRAACQAGVTYSATRYRTEEEAKSFKLPMPRACFDASGKFNCRSTTIKDGTLFRTGPWIPWTCHYIAIGKTCGSFSPNNNAIPSAPFLQYPTPTEAFHHLRPPPPECLTGTGQNLCTEVIDILERMEGGVVKKDASITYHPGAWRWSWSVFCVDPADIDAVVACTRPGAIPQEPSDMTYPRPVSLPPTPKIPGIEPANP